MKNHTIDFIPNVFLCFSNRKDGNMSFVWSEKDDVLDNRKNFLSNSGISIDDVVAMKVLDGDNFVMVDKNDAGKGMYSLDDVVSTDGLITSDKEIKLFLVIGDCLPIVIFDNNKKILSLIHCGWKSTDKKLAQKTIVKFKKEFNSNPDDISVIIGPCIKKESFCFVNPIQKNLDGWANFLEDKENGETCIDLVGYNKFQMMEEGVLENNIFIDPIDTAKNSDYFSHYRDSRDDNFDEGRFACIVGMM